MNYKLIIFGIYIFITQIYVNCSTLSYLGYNYYCLKDNDENCQVKNKDI